MTYLDSAAVTVPFVWEPYPPSGSDAVPAVIYRVGTPVDPLDATSRFSEAEEEATTYRWLPRLWSPRRRYLAVTAVEEIHDLRRPPHLRPALAKALAYARWCTGGILFERFDDLGNLREQASVLKLGLTYAGFPDINRLDKFDNEIRGPVGATLTIGYLGTSRGRRAAAGTEHATVARHGAALQARVRAAERHGLDAVHEATRLLKEAVDAVQVDHGGRIAWGAPACRSSLLADLSFEGARAYVQQLDELNLPDDRVEQLLNLFGFLNSKGHRVWHRAELRRLPEHNGRG